MRICEFYLADLKSICTNSRNLGMDRRKPIKTNLLDNIGIFESGQSIQKREQVFKPLVHPIYPKVKEEVCKWIRFR